MTATTATTRRHPFLMLVVAWVLTAVGCLPAAEPGDAARVRLVVGALADPAAAGFLPAAGAGFAERSIVAVRVRVSGEGLDTVVHDVPVSGELEIEVQTGPRRRFEVEALGAEAGTGGARVWGGVTVADIGSGLVDVRVLLSPTPLASTAAGRVVRPDGAPAAFARLAVVSTSPPLARLHGEASRSGGALLGVSSDTTIAGLAVDAAGPFGRVAGAYSVEVPRALLFSFRLRAESLDGTARAEADLGATGDLALVAATGRLEGTGELEVTILRPDGTAVTDATVLVGVDKAFAGAVVGAGGRVRFAALDPAALRVVAWRGDAAGPEVTAATATVRAGATAALEIRLPRLVPVDTRAPETTLTSAPSGMVNVKSASLVFTADEPATFECSLDGAAFAACVSPVALSGLADGPHVFRVRAIDVAGNVDATPAVANWSVDTAAPSVALTTVVPAASNVSSTTISFTFLADADIAVVECSLDGGERQACATPTATITGLADGPHTMAFYGRDAAGNTQAVPTTHTWTVDTTPPALTEVVLAGGAGTVTAPVVSLDVTAGGDAVTMWIAGDVFPIGPMAFTPTTTVTLIGSGPRTVTVTVADALDNRASLLDTITLDVNGLSGSIAALAPVTDAPVAAFALAVTSGGPPWDFEVRLTGDLIGGGAWQPFASTVTATMANADAVNTIQAEFRDSIFRTSPVTSAVVLWDATAPLVAVTAPADGTALAQLDTIAGTVSDAVWADGDLTVAVRIATMAGYYDEFGGFSLSEIWIPVSVVGGMWSLPVSGFTGDESYTIRARAVDGVNRSAIDEVAVDLDQSAPACGVCVDAALPYLPWTNSVFVDLLLDATDAHPPISVDVGGDVVAPGIYPYASTFTVELLAGDGNKGVTVSYIDSLGNTSGAYALALTLDTAPPVADSFELAGGLSVTSTAAAVPFGLLASGAVTMDLLQDLDPAQYGLPFASSGLVNLAPGDGLKTVRARLYDEAGNATDITDTIELSTGSPTITASTSSPATSLTAHAFDLAAFGPGAPWEVRWMGDITDATAGIWQPLTTPVQLHLTPGDGTKLVTFRIRSVSLIEGNDSAVAVTLDTSAPTCTLCAEHALPSFPYTSTTVVDLFTSSLFDLHPPIDLILAGDIAAPATGVALAPDSPLTVTLTTGDGPKQLRVTLRDALGNEATYVRDVTLDTTPPTGASLVLAGGAPFVTDSTVSVTAVAAGAFVMDLTGDTPFPLYGVAPTSVTSIELLSGEGLRSLWAQFRDLAGNQAVTAAAVYVDTVDPWVGVSLPVFASAVSEGPWIAGAADDIGGSGVTQVTISIFDGLNYFDGASFSMFVELELPVSGTTDWHSAAISSYALYNTDYTITARAYDAAGRVGWDVSSFVFDDMAPDCVTCFALNTAHYPWAGTTAVWADAPDVTDAQGPIEARWGGDIDDGFAGTWVGYSPSQPLSLTPGDGPKTVTVQFRDGLGNVSMLYSDSVTLDTLPPQGVAVVLAGGAMAVSAPTIGISFVADDAVAVSLTGDVPSILDQPLASVTSITLFAGDGAKTVFADLRDAAGNTTNTSAQIVLDTVGPGVYVALPGLQEVRSLQSGGLFDGAKPNDQLGNALAPIGDLDGDGSPDVIAGASSFTKTGFGFYHGAVYALSGVGLAPIWERQGPVADFFLGAAVGALGDVNEDGVPDVVVGAPLADTGGTDTGYVEVLSGSDGALLYAIAGTTPNLRFGNRVAGISDLNMDGTPDIIVGIGQGGYVGTNRGALYALSGTDGSVLWRRDGEADGVSLGSAAVVATVDLNSDGVPDILTAQPDSNFTAAMAGSVYARSGTDGSVIWRTDGPAGGFTQQFGSAVALIDDRDADGVPEIIVGQMGGDTGGTDAGAVFILDGRTGSILTSYVGKPGTEWGKVLSAAGDLDGDGYRDIAIGNAAFNIDGGQAEGVIWIISSQDGRLLGEFIGAAPDWGLGQSLAPVGDGDADDIDDLVTGSIFIDGAYGVDDNSGGVRLLRPFAVPRPYLANVTNAVLHDAPADATMVVGRVLPGDWMPLAPGRQLRPVNLPEGFSNLEFAAIDAVGNRGPIVAITAPVDLTNPFPPVITSPSFPFATSSAGSVWIEGSVTDPVSNGIGGVITGIRWSMSIITAETRWWDGGSFGAPAEMWHESPSTGTIVLSLPIDTEGVYKGRLVGLDGARRATTTPTELPILVDWTGPQGTITGPATVGVTTVVLTLAAADVGHAGGPFEMRLGGDVLGEGIWRPFATTHPVELAAWDGPHGVTAEFRDPLGNGGPLAATTVTLDLTPPMVMIAAPSPGAVTNVVPLVSGTANDPSGVTAVTVSVFDGVMYFDGASFTSLVPLRFPAAGTDTWTWGDLIAAPPSDGTYTIDVQGWDAIGRMGSDAVSFELDTTPPMCAPCMNVYVAGFFPYASSTAIQVEAMSLTDANGPVMARYSGDISNGFAGTWITPGAPQPLNLMPGDGAKNIAVEYVDAIGNKTAPYQAVVTLDTMAPTIIGYTPLQAPGLYGIGMALEFDVEFDEPVTYSGPPAEIGLDTGNPAAYNYPSSASGLRFTYTVQIGDMSGGLDALTEFTFNLNGATIYDKAGLPADLTLPLPGGPSSLATAAGWQIDGIAPSLMVGGPDPGSWINASSASGFSVWGSCTEDGSIWINGDLVDTVPCGGGVWSAILDASLNPDGPLNLIFSMNDLAGNPSAANPSLALGLDKTAPTAPAGVTAVAKPDGSVHVQWSAPGDGDLGVYYVGYGADAFLTGTNAFEGSSPLNIATSTTEVVLTGLPPGQPVHVNVWVGDIAGNLSTTGPDAVTTPYVVALPFARLDNVRPMLGSHVRGGWYWLEGASLLAVTSPVLEVWTESKLERSAVAVTLEITSATLARAWLPPLTPRMYGLQLSNASGATSTVLALPVPTTTPAEFKPLPTTSTTMQTKRWLPGKVSTDIQAERVIFACNNGAPKLYAVKYAGKISDETWRLPALSIDCVEAAWIDADDNGFMDILIANGSGQDALLLGDGSSWTDATATWLPVDVGATTGIAVGDFDRDGLPDIVIARTGQPRIWFNRGGFFGDGTAGTDYPAVSGWAQGRPAVADFTGDGYLDILFGTNNTVAPMFWTGTAGGTLVSDSFWVPVTIAKNHLAFEVADLDRDGDLDAVPAISGAQSYWLRNLGAQFEEVLTGLPVLTAAADVAVGDVDGDGFEDLAFAATPPRLWRNDGSAQFSASNITTASATWSSVALFDLDGDRDLDVLLGANADGSPLNLRNTKDLVVDESAKQVSVPTARYAGVAAQVDGPALLGQQMLVFGGDTAIGPSNALYALNLTDLAWTPVCDSGPCALALPTARARAAGSWNAYLRTLYIFGEESISPDDTLYGFRYDDLQWDTYAPLTRPMGRSAATLSWLPDGFWGMHYLFGGSTDGMPSGATNEIWSFDPMSTVWTDVSPVCGQVGIDCPEPRFRHAATEIGDDFVIIYGGVTAPTGGATNDLWQFVALQSTWSRLSARCPAGPPLCPPAMAGATAVYVESRNWIVVHGNDEGTAYPDVWAYDLNTSSWLEVCLGGSCGQGLPAYGGGYTIFDPIEAALLRFGGTADGGTARTNQLWRVWLK